MTKTQATLGLLNKKFLTATNKGVHKAGFYVVGKVQDSIAGREAEKTSVDTGQFLNSIPNDSDMSKFLISVIKTDLGYPIFLELGTTRITARPHFGNTAAREQKRVKEIIQEKIGRVK